MSKPPHPRRQRVHDIIFEHDTPAGKAFDVGLLWAVVLSVIAVTLESVETLREDYGFWLRASEWAFTALFTVEFGLRLYSAPSRVRYLFSFFGMVDLLAILPTYISIAVPGAQSLLVVRVLRLLRVFRVLKLASFRGEAEMLLHALGQSTRKITVFLFAVVTVVIVVGAAMYLVEGPSHGFTNIPRSMYWAIVTLTTVGYGDIAPGTVLGQALASLLMILGYGIIAVPTGIVSAEMTRDVQREVRALTKAQEHIRRYACPGCQLPDHRDDARFCRACGTPLASGERAGDAPEETGPAPSDA